MEVHFCTSKVSPKFTTLHPPSASGSVSGIAVLAFYSQCGIAESLSLRGIQSGSDGTITLHFKKALLQVVVELSASPAFAVGDLLLS